MSRTSDFQSWLEANDVQYDLRLQLVEDNMGIKVVAREDILDVGTAVAATIPKLAILALQTCTIAQHTEHLHFLHGPQAHLGLALALHVELLKNTKSRWWGYLQSLPEVPPTIPVFWGHEQEVYGDPFREVEEDAAQASRWAGETQIWGAMHSDGDDILSYEDIRQWYYTEASKVLTLSHLIKTEPYLKETTLSGFFRAYALVSSRAFLVDAYLGLSMVPLADAFNHTVHNHVHMESDFDVCPVCGSVDQCEHDEDDRIERSSKRTLDVKTEAAVCEMVVNAPIATGCEVFNTYGEHLSNAQLIVRYGFMLDNNENDVVSFDISQLRQIALEHYSRQHRGTSEDLPNMLHTLHTRMNNFALLWEMWKVDAAWESSILVFNAEMPSDRARAEPYIGLNADGAISHDLWLWVLCANAVHWDDATSPEDVLGQAKVVMEVQLRLEDQVTEDDDGMESEDNDAEGLDDLQGRYACNSHLLDLCSLIQDIIHNRRDRLLRGKTLTEVGDILDSLPESHIRTRMALTQTFTELSILEACDSKLHALLGVVKTA